jgi:MFS transporter, MHS family, proline/betaine transporter
MESKNNNSNRVTLRATHPAKYIYYISIGNFLENYDWALYIHFATLLSFLFFPSNFNPDDSILFGFCMTLICSFAANIVWGYIADTKGRKVPLVWSCIISAAVFFLIPIQGMIFERTIFSAIIFCLLRGMADFALTGEYLSTNIYIAESYKPHMTAFYSGTIDAICNAGVVVSLLISYVCLQYLPEKIGCIPSWTIPFFIGSSVGLVGYNVRKKVKESLDYQVLKYSQTEKIHSLKEIYRYYAHNINRLVGIEMLFGFGFVFVFIYCSKLLHDAGLSTSEILLNNALISVAQGVASFMWGCLGKIDDPIKVTKLRSYLLILWIVTLWFHFPSIMIDPTQIMIVQAISVTLGLDHIPAIGAFLKGLPTQARSRMFNRAFFIGKNVMYILTSFVIYKAAEKYGIYIIFFMWLTLGIIFAYCVHTYMQESEIPKENRAKFLH